MSFKEFLIKNVMNSFFISVTFICIGISVVGTVFEPEKQFCYADFLAPIIFGLAASLPSLVMFSRHELTVKEMLLRKLLHIILLELTVNGILFLTGALTSLSVIISLVLTILIIDIAVNIVMYLNDLRSAERINSSIKEMQSKADKE